MAYEDNIKKMEQAHHLIMEGRERLSLSGVEDVESFDENAIIMYTSKGLLTIRGTELHIERLSLEGGEVNVEGFVDSIEYQDSDKARRGLFARLFK